jgi:chromosome partitioning protein
MLQTMRVIVFASQKGGSGKTTLAGHIGVQAELAGAGPVALIDTDPQGSLAKWWNCREAATPAFIHSVFTNLVHDIDEARSQGFKLVVIDTPPAVTKAISEVVSLTIDIVEARKKQMIFALNAATPRARITMEAAVALSQHGTVAPVTVYNRTDFAASMIDGRTVMEIEPEGKSAEEVRGLWDYIYQRLLRLDASVNEAGEVVQAAPLFRNMNSLGREVPVFGRRAV